MSQNQQIISQLEALAEIYQKQAGQKFRYQALQKAIFYIRQYPHAITSGKEAQAQIEHVGAGIARRIDEILTHGRLAELDARVATKSDNKMDIRATAIRDLTRITGVGEGHANAWYKRGIKNVAGLRNAVASGEIKLTHHMQIGLKYLDEFERRIPRREIERAEPLLYSTLKQIDRGLVFHICGSYRRGRADCGDIDILITKKGCENRDEAHHYLQTYVRGLAEKGFLTDDLTIKGEKKYMGVCLLESQHARIDIRYVEYSAYYSALIYFTGSKNFNLLIRNKAIELGYSLSEYGLKEKSTDKLITVDSEEEVFRILGMEYLEPRKREM